MQESRKIIQLDSMRFNWSNTITTLFISDLHLEAEEPQITAGFLSFLNSQARQADALYILGDFFEAWLGDDDRTEFNKQIIHALKQLTDSGVPVYFMRGNRDFMIGRRFAKATGVTLMKDPTTITLYGQRILLMHGDSLCTCDIKHQKFRKKYNCPFLRVITAMLPLWFRRKYGRKLRNYSQQQTQSKANQIMDVTPEEVIRVMSQKNITQLIHGHTHRPAIHSLKINGHSAERIVLGSWHEAGSVLVYEADGKHRLETLPYEIQSLTP